MALLYVEEFGALGDMNVSTSPFRRSNGEIPQTPSLVTQTPIAIGVGSVQSAAFGASTYLVRLNCDVVCSVLFGANPTVTAANMRLAANQTEYFAVVPGQKVAVITNT